MSRVLCSVVPLLLFGAGMSWSEAMDPQTPVQPSRAPSPSTAVGQLPWANGVSALSNKPMRSAVVPGAAVVVPAPGASSPIRPLTAAAPGGASSSNPLVWDHDFKETTAKPGDTNALITFHFTNLHTAEIVINAVRASCGCTTLQLPPMPWHVPPGSNGQLTANMDLRGRRGVQTKSLSVESSLGYKSLLFKVVIPPELVTTTVNRSVMDPERIRNMQVAVTDRQAVFKNPDCVRCHLEPVKGKLGEKLQVTACGICHDSPNRATIVPDLRAGPVPTSPPYWKYWIVNGRPGSLMPAFGVSRGGPLTEQEVNSLVERLTETITRQARPPPGSNPTAPRPASVPAGASKATGSPGVSSTTR